MQDNYKQNREGVTAKKLWFRWSGNDPLNDHVLKYQSLLTTQW